MPGFPAWDAGSASLVRVADRVHAEHLDRVHPCTIIFPKGPNTNIVGPISYLGPQSTYYHVSWTLWVSVLCIEFVPNMCCAGGSGPVAMQPCVCCRAVELLLYE